MHLSMELFFVKKSKNTENHLPDQANAGIVNGVNLSTKQNVTIKPKKVLLCKTDSFGKHTNSS